MQSKANLDLRQIVFLNKGKVSSLQKMADQWLNVDGSMWVVRGHVPEKMESDFFVKKAMPWQEHPRFPKHFLTLSQKCFEGFFMETPSKLISERARALGAVKAKMITQEFSVSAPSASFKEELKQVQHDFLTSFYRTCFNDESD